MHVIRTHAPFHPLYILVLTQRPQYVPDLLSDLFKESLSPIFRDEYDMITAILAGVGQTIGTHGHRPPLLGNWMAKPFSV